MDGAFSVGDSHDWEEKCKQLLAIRYGDDLQLIDASHGGDLGLEAFTQQSCLGFQCYAPLEPLSTQERYEKHRDKLTRDLGKLERNQDALVIILGATRLKRYVFMVPRFDPPLLTHCGSKRDEFRNKGLAILADDFDIVVQTEENYPLERAQLVEVALAPLDVGITEVAEDAKARWAEANLSLVDTLTTKIGKFNLGQVQSDDLRDEFLKHYLRREHLLDQVFTEAPDTYLRLEQTHPSA